MSMPENKRSLTYMEAIREALQEEMRRDPGVFILGEDIARHGGAFGTTKELWEEFGDLRVINTPISENGFVGAALGAAMTGARPVVEIMFADFATLAIDQICNQAAKMCYMTGGQTHAPMVVRLPQGGLSWKSAGAHHSQSLEAWYVHIPGLKVVFPSSPYDAKGLMKAAIRDDNPVIFIEHKALYGLKGSVPKEEYLVPIGEAVIKRPGQDVTILACGFMTHLALQAAETLSQFGIEAEVIDPRSLKPLDEQCIYTSVRKTHRVVLVQEASKTGGIAAEWGMLIQENCFDWLDAPIARLAGQDVPIPYAKSLEDRAWPKVEEIVRAAKDVCYFPEKLDE